MKLKIAASLTFLSIAGSLLFLRLGHYALWEDEAETALFGESILATGDTSAVLGHNIEAFDDGELLNNLHERIVPPMQYYLAAASFGILGKTALAARMPFALCGLATFALIFFWLIHDHADGWTAALTSLAFLTNVSLLLYCRQARYYAVVILLSVALAYLYTHWNRSWKTQASVVLLLFCLLTTHYTGFGAAVACMVVDWLIWGRAAIRLNWTTAVWIAVLLIVSIVFLRIYNPLHPIHSSAPRELRRTLIYAWWSCRDLSVNQFWILPVLLSIPIVWRYCGRDLWLLRGGVAVLIYFACVSVLAIHGTGAFGEIRYYCGLLPLTIALQARVIRLAVGKNGFLAIIVGLPILATNVLSGSVLASPGLFPQPMQCTFVSFVQELLNPPGDPYTAASAWLNQNVPANSSVLALPYFTAYPLMFHAPQFLYAWQLSYPPAPQFKGLADIHFAYREWPQYIAVFGVDGIDAAQVVLGRAPKGAFEYRLATVIPMGGREYYRPELFLRTFDVLPVDLHRAAIYILRRDDKK